jgi:hypothetical protein
MRFTVADEAWLASASASTAAANPFREKEIILDILSSPVSMGRDGIPFTGAADRAFASLNPVI